MTEYPPSLLERVGDGDPWPVYYQILKDVRDALYKRALAEGASGVTIMEADAILAEQCPWMPEEERAPVAYNVLTYGVGSKLWDNRFTRDGVEVPYAEVRDLIYHGTPEQHREIVVEWPLKPQEDADASP